MFSVSTVTFLLSQLPAMIQAVSAAVGAVQQIAASDQAHTLESAVKEFVDHATQGKPNSPALAPDAPRVLAQ